MLVGLLLLAACGGNDEDNEDGESQAGRVTPAITATDAAEPASTATPEPDETAAEADATLPAQASTTETPGSSSTPAPTEPMSEEEAALARQLLQVEDLPEGWAHAPQLIPADPPEGATGVCGKPNLSNAAQWRAEAETAFASPRQQFVLERLGTLSEEEAIAFMEQVRESTDCDEFTDQGGIAFSVAPLALPAAGDESAAFRMSGGGADYDFAYVRVGGTVMLLSQAAPQGSIDSDLTTSLLESAVQRITEDE